MRRLFLAAALLAAGCGSQPSIPVSPTPHVAPVKANVTYELPDGRPTAVSYTFMVAFPHVPKGARPLTRAEREVSRKNVESWISKYAPHLKIAPTGTTGKGLQVVYRFEKMKSTAPATRPEFFRHVESVDRATISQSTEGLAFYFSGETTDATLLLKEASTLVYECARGEGGGVIIDELTTLPYSPSNWKKDRLDSSQSKLPRVSDQSAMWLDNGTLHTLGYTRLGWPELRLDGVTGPFQARAGDLLGIVGQMLVEGGGKQLTILPENVKHSAVAQYLQKNREANAGTVTIRLLTSSQGEWRVDLSSFPGHTDEERCAALLQAVFGVQPSQKLVQHDEELMAASKRAREDYFAKVQSRIRAGLKPGERLFAKGAFYSKDRSQHEYMWIEVLRLSKGTLEGTALDDAYFIPEMKAGSKVSVREADLFDYRLADAKGVQGGETDKILRARE